MGGRGARLGETPNEMSQILLLLLLLVLPLLLSLTSKGSEKKKKVESIQRSDGRVQLEEG